MDKTVPDSKYSYERFPAAEEKELLSGSGRFSMERYQRKERPLYIYFRRHLHTFLRDLRSSGVCQVVAFTLLVKERADAIIDCIERCGQGGEREVLFEGRLYREHCCWVPKPSGKEGARYLQSDLVAPAAALPTRMSLVKDFLTAVPQANAKRSVIINADVAGCAAHMRNSMCVKPFYGEPDNLLENLKPILIDYASTEDVREVCMRGALCNAWNAYKQQQSLDLTEESEPTPWSLEEPYPYEPEEETSKPSTGRKIYFGSDSFSGGPTRHCR